MHTYTYTLTINLVNINSFNKKREHSRSFSGSSHPLCVKTVLHSYTQIAKSTNNLPVPKIQAEDTGFLTFNAMELCKIYPLDRAGGGGRLCRQTPDCGNKSSHQHLSTWQSAQVLFWHWLCLLVCHMIRLVLYL